MYLTCTRPYAARARKFGPSSIINLVVDFLEDEKKKKDLLNGCRWNTFKNERPLRLASGPHHPALDYWHGLCAYRQWLRCERRERTSRGVTRRSPGQTQRTVWDRVAQAADRGATFPPLRAPLQ